MTEELETDYSEILYNMEIKRDGIISDLNVKRGEYELLDTILDPFKEWGYKSPHIHTLKRAQQSPIYEEYKAFATQWIPDQQVKLEKTKVTKVKNADKILSPFKLKIETVWQDQKQFNKDFDRNVKINPSLSWESNPLYNMFRTVIRSVKPDYVTQRGYAYQLDSDCKKIPQCLTVYNTWDAIRNWEHSRQYCVLDTEHVNNKECVFVPPADAFVRDRQKQIKPIKTEIKQKIQSLTQERIDTNTRIKSVQEQARLENNDSIEREKLDFNLWIKRHTYSPNTRQYAHTLAKVVDVPEIRNPMVEINKNQLLQYAESAITKYKTEPSIFDTKAHEQWEKKYDRVDVRYGETFVNIIPQEAGKSKYEIKQDMIDHVAEKNTTYAINRFLQKNVSKVATILDKRPDCDQFEANMRPITTETFNGTIKTTCQNSDQFSMQSTLTFVNEYYKPSINAMVSAYSKYPTIFFDVYYKNQKIEQNFDMIKNQVSEQWMNEQFTKS